MMTFKAINETTAVATNSLRKVEIVRQVSNKFDRNEWMVYTPNGRLLDDIKVAGPFESFERAKRDAECTVGMAMNWSDF